MPAEKYTFVIKNYEKFMMSNTTENLKIENRYENYLLPFWDEKVERVVVDGRRREFDIYLASNSYTQKSSPG